MGDGQKLAMASKINLLPGVIAVLVGGMVAFLLTQFQLSIWIEPSGSESTSPPVLDADPIRSPAVPSVQPQSPAVPQPPIAANSLRVSNQTSYPIRVVLLANNTEPVANSPTEAFRKPVHWDFAPTEGGTEGLILSLPQGSLELYPGDVLVAFALDGSRHYWGPYIVGETSVPAQKGQPPVWELLIRP